MLGDGSPRKAKHSPAHEKAVAHGPDTVVARAQATRFVLVVWMVLDLNVIAGVVAIAVYDQATSRSLSIPTWLIVSVGVNVLVQLVLAGWSDFRGRGGWRPLRLWTTPRLSIRAMVTFAASILAFALLEFIGIRTATTVGMGGPGSPRPGCPWPLDNHTTFTCVSHATYVLAQSELQRFLLGPCAIFYLVALIFMSEQTGVTDYLATKWSQPNLETVNGRLASKGQ
jgi:hypothetical protein